VDQGLSLADVEVLYRRYSHSVLYRCQQILRDEEVALDAMHQTFVRAIRYRSGYRGSGPVAWLFSIAVRVCLDQLRKSKEDQLRADVDADELAATFEDTEGVSFERRLDQQRIIAALLPHSRKGLQEIVVMRYFDEMEIREIAEKTSLSQRTVARRLSEFLRRARRLVRER
jgi:RNA polymerase sigma-70 factor (ECF subfamily)